MRIFLTLIITTILLGCISKQEYPADWKQVDTSTSNCPDISGAYSNLSEPSENGYEFQLSSLFGLNIDPPETINLELKEYTLKISAFDTNKNIASIELNFRPEILYCEKGFLVFEKDKFHNREGALGKEWQTFSFSANEDGLILNQTQGAIGMLFIVPIAGSESRWAMFKRIT